MSLSTLNSRLIRGHQVLYLRPNGRLNVKCRARLKMLNNNVGSMTIRHVNMNPTRPNIRIITRRRQDPVTIMRHINDHRRQIMNQLLGPIAHHQFNLLLTLILHTRRIMIRQRIKTIMTSRLRHLRQRIPRTMLILRQPNRLTQIQNIMNRPVLSRSQMRSITLTLRTQHTHALSRTIIRKRKNKINSPISTHPVIRRTGILKRLALPLNHAPKISHAIIQLAPITRRIHASLITLLMHLLMINSPLSRLLKIIHRASHQQSNITTKNLMLRLLILQRRTRPKSRRHRLHTHNVDHVRMTTRSLITT